VANNKTQWQKLESGVYQYNLFMLEIYNLQLLILLANSRTDASDARSRWWQWTLRLQDSSMIDEQMDSHRPMLRHAIITLAPCTNRTSFTANFM